MVLVKDFEKLEQLQTQEQIKLLDVIDALRAEGLGDYTSLPQLIVCGDQSSGKSSVLEAISGVPFPRKDTICTRFATEVILRRAENEYISVSLAPGKTRSADERASLLDFCYNLSSREEFPALFEKAKHAMGLDALGSQAFSEDILRVEISGPAQPQLTLVDLPGLIHSENKKQSVRDVKLVHQLVESYMQNERSIILAVVSAMNEFANQIVLSKARTVDPHGDRTIGIITKPDTLRTGTTLEAEFLALARNENIKFQLGWHVVKNLDLGAVEEQDKDRDSEEALFFQTSNFKSLPTSGVGIASLRQRLSQVLFHQVRSELPKLVADIKNGISVAQDALDRLGPSRTTFEEQRAYLIKLSQDFQALAKDAIIGHYSNQFFKEPYSSDRRLCAVVANSHDNFKFELRVNGSKWITSENKENKPAKGSRGKYITRKEAIKKIQDLLLISRGRELPGLFNPLLVGEVFREYSEPWERIARTHVRAVWKSTKLFLEELSEHLTDASTCETLCRELLDPIMDERLEIAFSKLIELVASNKDHPTTLNTRFQDMVTSLQNARKNALITGRIQELFSKQSQIEQDDIDLIMSAVDGDDSSNTTRKTAEDIFDYMSAFYETALDTFLDNVPSLVIQETIINRVPLMFCPASVSDMEPDMVHRIASESDSKRTERKELSRKLEVLNTGYKMCKRHAIRVSSGQVIFRNNVEVEEEGYSSSDEDEPTGSVVSDDANSRKS